jgi:hypothetical protein
MSVKVTVEQFVVEGATRAELAARIASHFGHIADSKIPDSGLAIAHTFEGADETPVGGEDPRDPASSNYDPEAEGAMFLGEDGFVDQKPDAPKKEKA